MSSNTNRFNRSIDFMSRGRAAAHVPLLEAAEAGCIDIVFVSHRQTTLPFSKVRKSCRAVFLFVCNDDDASTGLEGWAFAIKNTQWAKGAIVHGTGAKREHYEMAVRGALKCRWFLVVDTTSRHAAAWAALLKHVQSLVLVPTSDAHPVTQKPEIMH